MDDVAPFLRPLPPLTFYVDQMLFGADRAGAWHLTSIGLHALNAVLIAAVLRRPFGALAAIAAALVFGFHPVHTEPVGWISGRYDLLAGTFLLASVLIFLRGRPGLSVLAFAAALLSKEFAVTLPLLLTAYLLWKRRPLRESGWHWAVLAAYVVYRWVALGGPGIGTTWTPDVTGWFLKPWAALAYPLPGGVTGWYFPEGLPIAIWGASVIVCTAVVFLVLSRPRLACGFILAVAVVLLPAIAVFQLGPNFEFGRYMYWAVAVWSVLIGLALRSPSRAVVALLGVYLIVLLSAGVVPRVRFQQVGAAGRDVIEATKDSLGQPAAGASVVAYGVPVREHGWIVFGDYLGVALDRAYGYLRDGDVPGLDVTDAGWEREVGRSTPVSHSGDIVLRWNADTGHMTACANRDSAVLRGLDQLEHPCPPEPAMSLLDFGTEDLFLYRSEGFRWNESDGRETWNWMTAPRAELSLPLDIEGNGQIRLRLASAVPNTLTVRVNEVDVGRIELPGGFHWQETAVYVPRGAWKPGLYQDVAFEARRPDAGRYVAFSEAAFLPVESETDIDFGSVSLSLYEAEGFGGAERDAGVTWNWAEAPDASLEVPLYGAGDRRILLRLMSAVEQDVQIYVNDVAIGEVAVQGDHRWRESAVYVRGAVWRDEPAQAIRLEASLEQDGHHVAVDRITISEVPAVDRVDFGRSNLSLYQAEGFSGTTRESEVNWMWMDGPSASLELPLDTSGDREFRLRLTAADDARVKVLVNGAEMGRLVVFGGFEWQDAAVPVPESAWREGPTQTLRIESATAGQDLHVGIDTLEPSNLRWVDEIDFGSESLALYQASGFRQNEPGGDGTSWSWVNRASAELELPIEASGLVRIGLRVMSSVANVLSLWVNGLHVGELSVGRGFQWQDLSFFVLPSVWRDAPAQNVRLEAAQHDDGLRVALDRMTISHLSDGFDFGTGVVDEYGGSGFRWDETDGVASWNWTVEPSAEIALPVDTASADQLSLRVMTTEDSRVRVSVNGSAVGDVDVEGGAWWQGFALDVPESAWAPGLFQSVRIEAFDAPGPLYVGIDSITFGH